MDIEAYRRDFLTQVEAAADEPETASPEDVAGYAVSDDGNAETLCGMIRRLPFDEASFPGSARTLLDILGNDSVGTSPRLVALDLLGAMQFQPGEFAPFHADYIELLRRLVLSSDARIREAVLERLTLVNDPHAQRLLLEGLDNVRKPLVPAAKAVQLLARDDHGSALPLFRRLAAEGKGAVREQALRALAADASSTALFEAIATDKNEGSPLRQIAAANLKGMSATKFAKVASAIVLDDDEDVALRATAASAIAHTVDVANALTSAPFHEAVEAAGARTKSRTLKSSINRLTKSLATRSAEL